MRLSAFVARLSLLALLLPMRATAQPSLPLCVLHAEPARYPETARLAKIEGTFSVEVSVAPDGRVIKARMINGHPMFDYVVEEAAKNWTFDPEPEINEERPLVLDFSFHLAFEPSTNTRCEAHFTPPSTMEILYIRATVLPLEGDYPKECPVHGLPLQRGVVPISFGLPSSDSKNPYVKATNKYLKESRKKFPLAMHAVWGGCMRGVRDHAEVLFCPACRAEEEKWANKHPLASRRAPGLAGGNQPLLDF